MLTRFWLAYFVELAKFMIDSRWRTACTEWVKLAI